MRLFTYLRPSQAILTAFLIITIAAYWPGLHGTFLFDDYPNIVDNKGVQPDDASLPSLIQAALSSPSSMFRRPLASLSFAANYLATGLDPFGMKLTNLVIHLVNGLLVFLLARMLLRRTVGSSRPNDNAITSLPPASEHRIGVVAALIAGGWMLLPINLTAVLYVVQRMESLANVFILLGLMGYVAGRNRMLAATTSATTTRAFMLCAMCITVPTALGLMAKETGVLLPLYAMLIEWVLFGFSKPLHERAVQRDWRVISLFLLVLAAPLLAGLIWQAPKVLNPAHWATRDFTLETRLLSEARIVTEYIAWTLLPTPGALSFYHDDFRISTGLLTPVSTLISIGLLGVLVGLMCWLRQRRPLIALGIALFLGGHLLTGTILPLELIYEHRNYFASFGLLLVIIPLLVPLSDTPGTRTPWALPRYTLLAGLMLWWTALTAVTALAWSNPLRLAEDLAARAPESPRAQYELGRTYIVLSNYDLASPFTQAAYAPLEKAVALPGSSILPEQALIFMNARMRLPIKDAWWTSLIDKLKARKPGVQDESSLGALTKCAREQRCDLPIDRMMEAFIAALSHPSPRPRLLAVYGDYAWNVVKDQNLGLRMLEEAVKAEPGESAYRITLIRMLIAQGRKDDARTAIEQLQPLNIGGRLNKSLSELKTLLD